MSLSAVRAKVLDSVVEAEGFGGIVLCINHQGEHRHFNAPGPNNRVSEKRAAKLLAVTCLVDGEVADRRWGHCRTARQALGRRLGQIGQKRTTRRQGLVPGDPAVRRRGKR